LGKKRWVPKLAGSKIRKRTRGGKGMTLRNPDRALRRKIKRLTWERRKGEKKVMWKREIIRLIFYESKTKDSLRGAFKTTLKKRESWELVFLKMDGGAKKRVKIQVHGNGIKRFL